jgi:AraC-like DNA-binding protein
MKVLQFTIPVLKDNSIHVQEDKQPHFYEHLHRHNETQITWILHGKGTLITRNSMQRFKDGDIFIIGANQAHLFKSDPAYFKNNKKLKIHSLNIFFNPGGLIYYLLSFPEIKRIKKFINASNYGMQVYEKDQKKLYNRILKIKNSSSGFRFAAFIELLQEMAEIKKWKYLSNEFFKSSITDSEGLRMNDIYQYTMVNFAKTITLKQIAKVAFLTTHSFCRYFKKHTSKTYISFLNEIRINEACKRLSDNQFGSISEVALESGFNNVVSFNRVFKSMIHKSPREFMKEYKNGTESV